MLDRGNRHQAGALALGFEVITGVQVRHPLADRKLAEFCYAIPDDQFFRDGVDRALIKRVMANRLPDAILKAPRGIQTADWYLRLRRDAPRYREELEQLSEDSTIAARLDLPRLRRALATLPDRTPLTRREHPDQAMLELGLSRALAVARFIRAVEGRNR
jgi:asparagine synthase (glutamine-hydrolysing)